MRVALTLSLCALLSSSPLLAAPPAPDVEAAADSCGWSAQMEEDEGGPIMVASSCESDTDIGPVFRLQCGGEINIRYNGTGMGANPPASGTLVLTSAGKSLDADVVFEEMDGAYAAYVKMDSPIISMMKTGTEIGVAVKELNLPLRMVSLKGSTAAIDKLIDACK